MTRTLAILEALIDVVAIVGLVVLAALHVVSGEVVVPLISLVAGGSIGARLAGRKPPSEPKGGTPADVVEHVSVLALVLLPLLHLATSARVRTAAALFVVCVLATSCAGSELPATLWRLTRGACAVVVALPAGAEPEPEEESGVKAVELGPVLLVDVADGGAP